MMLLLSLLALLITGSDAFVNSAVVVAHKPPHTTNTAAATTVTSLNLIMTESEIQTILMKANGCVESECAISDVDDLISELKDQQRVLNARLETIMNVVAHLQTANSKVGDNRKTDDVRNIVKDMLRVFTTVDDKFAMGFSGDIGDGPSTAYDALPPKPWKASS